MDRGLREQSFACTASDRLIRLRSRDVSSTASKTLQTSVIAFSVYFLSEAPLLIPRSQELCTAWEWRLHTCTKCGHSYTEELAKLPSQTNQADQTNQIEPVNNGNEKDFIGTVTSVFLNVTDLAAKNFRNLARESSAIQ